MNNKSQKSADKRCTLSDRDVELMRELHEHPVNPMSLTQLAEKFEVHRQHVVKIVSYRSRTARSLSASRRA